MSNDALEVLRQIELTIGLGFTAMGICITLAAWGIASAVVSLSKKDTDKK